MKKLDDNKRTISRLNFKMFHDRLQNNKTSVFLFFTNQLGNKGKTLDIDIDFGESINGGRINIYWPNINYIEEGKHGYYDADYCYMEFDSETFIINDTKKGKVTIYLDYDRP